VRYTRFLVAFLVCLALPGCYVKTYGLQTAGGGTNATIVASQSVATTGFSNGRASFSFGQPVPAGAPGGQATFGRGGALFLAVGLVVADAVQSLGGWLRPGPVMAQGQAVERISETCSCYKPENER
jgi:hypothetical protein